MDQLRERFDALEQQVQTLHQQTHTMARRLRWWRGLACGFLVLGLFSLALPASRAADGPPQGVAHQVAALEDMLTAFHEKLAVFTFDSATNEVVITGANLRIVNGLGSTESTNGLGNLIVGYNELRGFDPDVRTGSHNVVVGTRHNFSSFGGLVVGDNSEISGPFASVSGGHRNTASGPYASVSGGADSVASGEFASSVSAGNINRASGPYASVSGGMGNTASGHGSSVSGGAGNRASGIQSAVSGGINNTASAFRSSVSGGAENTAGGSVSETAASSVSGGFQNTASGRFSAVSGGFNRTAPEEFDWAACSLFEEQ